jgi:hypothetical protein
MWYSWMMQSFFRGTQQGIQYFSSYPDTFYNMLVLLTTTNFPDIMLPAYSTNRLYGFFFMVYLLIGFYLFMSMLLAVFYSNFKNRYIDKLDAGE